MNICICGPVNPFELKDYISSEDPVLSINKGASAVNTYVKELLRNHHQVTVITSDVPLSITEDITYSGENFTIYVVNSKPGLFLFHGFSRFYMVNRLKRYIRKVLPNLDVLHCQWTYDYAMASMTFAKQIPVFCTVRDWCPYIIKVQSSFLKKVQWALYYLQFRYVMSSKDITFIANSEYTKDCILSLYPKKNIPVIYNPIDKTLILEKKKNIIQNPTFISIASSATEKRKNIPLLLEAFSLFVKKHPTAKLLLVGGGFELSNPVFDLYREKGWLTNVELLGRKSHMGVIAEIDKSTCLVHPALEETFGNILLEGMARRVVVIGGEHSGAVPFVLQNGKCGILCDVTSVESIVNAMEKSLDEKTAIQLLNDGTDYLLNTYSSDVVLNRHIDLFNQRIK